MPQLGVNIDHVATVRQARRTNEPDPVWAAALAELGGADGITLHLREDRRHISDRDLRILRQTVTVKLNLEMACEPEIIEIACQVKPDQATLVPERREEITTEGGLDVAAQRDRVARAIDRLRQAGISVSLFLDPDPRQIEAAARLAGRRRRIAHRPIRLGRAGPRPAEGAGKPPADRRPGASGGHDPSRRPRTDLPQRPPGRGHRRHARVEHRPQHRRPRHHGRLRGRRAGDEAAGVVRGVVSCQLSADCTAVPTTDN